MPTFLSKVFARGKEKEKEKGKDGLKEPLSPTAKQVKRNSRASAQSLLEGKFEAVSPSVSPSAEKYDDRDQALKKDKEKEKGGLFRPRSRTGSAGDATQKLEEAPQLKLDLNLPSIKDSKKRNLSIVYEGDTLLDEIIIGEKRLNPADALKLMRACSSVLTSRGLDSLGIMHPHWHSASLAAQRKIISEFLSSLTASSEPSASASFGSELEFARSPHDVAAVFRWALRHLKLEGDTFDKENTPSLVWYDNFTEKEKEAGYPKTAYSDLLLPTVNPSHAELLNSTLSLVSRLASHSEWNGTSGSKLSLLFGHYLLTGNRVDDLEDWIQFYTRWEVAGRALEHIFLSSLRDEEAKTGIPKRLSELVANYPYVKSSPGKQFPRPTRFATRSYNALYVRVSGESSHGKRSREEVYLPIQIVENALQSDITEGSEDKELLSLWEEVRKLSSVVGDGADGNAPKSSLANIIADDSVRVLSLKSDGSDKETPTISMFTSVPEHDAVSGSPTTNGRVKVTNGSASVSRQTSEATASSPIVADWSVFSSAGFGESTAGQSLAATLLDSDLEKTEPPKLAARRSLKKSRSPGRASRTDRAREPPSSPSDAPVRFKTSRVSLVKIDEAFVDFWSDALLDPISDTWPNFIVCQLKSDAVRARGDSKIAWLVIEQKLVTPSTPAPPSPNRRASSPRPSARSVESRTSGLANRKSATFSPRKRFNFFGTSQASSSPTVSGSEKRDSKFFSKGAKGAKVNELGEVIPEEKAAAPTLPTKSEEQKSMAPETKAERPKEEAPKDDAKRADDVAAGVAAIATGAAAVGAGAAAEAPAPEPEELGAPPQAEEVKEPVKEEAPDLPAKAFEPELATEPKSAAPIPEKGDNEEISAASVNQKKEAADEAPQSPEVPANQAEEVHEEAKIEDRKEPAAGSAPKATPADVEPVPEPTPEEQAPLPPAKEAKAEGPAPSTEVLSDEAEVAAAGAQGVADSRFVEHIDNTPPQEQPAELEPVAEQEEEAKQPEVEPEAEEPAVTLPPVEETAELADGDAAPAADVPPVAAETGVHVDQDDVEVEKARAADAAKPVPEATEEPAVTEEATPGQEESVPESKAPDKVGEPPSAVPAETDSKEPVESSEMNATEAIEGKAE